MTIEISLVMAKLFSCCRAKETGTFFVVSEEGVSGQVVIDNGLPIRSSFSGKKGIEALSELKSMNVKTFYFSADFMMPMSKYAAINQSDDVLALLGYADYLASLDLEIDEYNSINTDVKKEVSQKPVVKKEAVGMYRGQQVYKEVESEPEQALAQKKMIKREVVGMYRGQPVYKDIEYVAE
ncbi:MAG: hypothetical protein K9L22_11745 [Methylococcaceae bacterium]|nr:hypothetical protein [Methylococcaceae bacterium]